MNSNQSPIVWQAGKTQAPHRSLCTDCGVSRVEGPVLSASDCGSVCQFIKPDYPHMEALVHGRARDANKVDELFFGPMKHMVRARLTTPLAGAQTGRWTLF
jgi:coenzyme F420 hydrogenase subunit beta